MLETRVEKIRPFFEGLSLGAKAEKMGQTSTIKLLSKILSTLKKICSLSILGLALGYNFRYLDWKSIHTIIQNKLLKMAGI